MSDQAHTPLPSGVCGFCGGSGRTRESSSLRMEACTVCAGSGVTRNTGAAPVGPPTTTPLEVSVSPYDREDDGSFFRRMGEKISMSLQDAEPTVPELSRASWPAIGNDIKAWLDSCPIGVVEVQLNPRSYDKLLSVLLGPDGEGVHGLTYTTRSSLLRVVKER